MLPEIPLSEIQEMAKQEDPMDFLFVFISPYITLEQQKADLSESQRSLLAFNDMFREIYNGGFIQLIINGCGKNVFCSSFVKDLEKWGAHNIAAIVKRGKALYDTHKEEIEGATEFDDLDQDYYDFMDDTEDSENIKQYILEHLDEFAEIKN